MLTKATHQPFQRAINSLKKAMKSQSVDKQHLLIKQAVNPIISVANLNQLLVIVLDQKWLLRLTKLFKNFLGALNGCSNAQSQDFIEETIKRSPLKTFDRQREQVLRKLEGKHVQKTSTTIQSRYISTPDLSILLEDLVEELQTFPILKSDSSEMRFLIEELEKEWAQNKENIGSYSYESIQKEGNPFGHEEDKGTSDFSEIWENIQLVRWSELIEESQAGDHENGTTKLKQIVEYIQDVYNFMKAIKQGAAEIMVHLDRKAEQRKDCRNKDDELSYSVENFEGLVVSRFDENLQDQQTECCGKGSEMEPSLVNNESQSQKKSLLTEALRDSSQNTNFQGDQNFYTSRIIARGSNKTDYRSHRRDLGNRESVVDVCSKIAANINAKRVHAQNRRIMSEMDHSVNGDQNGEKTLIRNRREVKIKQRPTGCSQCQIF